ncbi:MAG: hypothetical protein DRP65_00950 [Planctomycetota bacterium]|nr:MAG: hypothetical protein DRP65_00950 [Planctomycetota bacterium]
MKILLTDGGLKHTLAALRYLSFKGHEVSVLGNNRACSRFSRYVNRYICYNPQSNFGIEHYCSVLLEEIRKHKYDLLIPIGSWSVECVSKYAEQINHYTKTIVADNKKIRMALNKRLSHDFVASIGVPVPTTFFPQKIEEIESFSAKVKYPVVIKAIMETGGSIVDYAYDQSDLQNKYNLMCRENSFSTDNLPMLQEYIDGTGWGFFALYQNGVCKQVFMHRRIREFPPSGGFSCCAESVFNEELKYYGLKILDHLKWHGIVMVEFRRRRADNKFFFLELNPKFWGSLELALASGANFPDLIARIAAGEESGYSETYNVGLRFHWPLDGDIKHAFKKPAHAGSIIRDCLNPSVKSNIYFADPMPVIIQFAQMLVMLFK